MPTPELQAKLDEIRRLSGKGAHRREFVESVVARSFPIDKRQLYELTDIGEKASYRLDIPSGYLSRYSKFFYEDFRISVWHANGLGGDINPICSGDKGYWMLKYDRRATRQPLPKISRAEQRQLLSELMATAWNRAQKARGNS